MSPAEATTAMRQKADAIAIDRAKLAGVFRSLNDHCGRNGLRSIIQTEFQRVTGANDNDKGAWIG